MATHHKLTIINWELSSKLILSQLHEKLPKNSTSTILWLFGIWSKLERWKKPGNWVPQELMKIKKKTVILKCRLLLFCATRNHFSIGSWCAKKVDYIWQPVMTSSVAGHRSARALPKAKRVPEKGTGHCLVVCCPSNALQLS